jgi:hypothetical protein
MMDTSRQRKPFLDTVSQDMADDFFFSGMCSSTYHLVKGGFETVCKNVPRRCCSTTVFFGVYAVVDYAVVSARRKKELMLDCTVAMDGAAGITRLHKGLRYAGKSTLFGAAFGGVASGGFRLLEVRRQNLSPQALQKWPCRRRR